ncbi:calcium binding egf domain-containing protein [Toxoplasma gondii CAST]|uniref:Calcium binding egf domain-containing protein n=1 Tax=Toxoplasma gondii CAST TaxID=943122 RepID=A0A3R7YUK8_TOXGO|nr:calcium binding egf domain-containing protein [Toxoplasma gondii CAST]
MRELVERPDYGTGHSAPVRRRSWRTNIFQFLWTLMAASCLSGFREGSRDETSATRSSSSSVTGVLAGPAGVGPASQSSPSGFHFSPTHQAVAPDITQPRMQPSARGMAPQHSSPSTQPYPSSYAGTVAPGSFSPVPVQPSNSLPLPLSVSSLALSPVPDPRSVAPYSAPLPDRDPAGMPIAYQRLPSPAPSVNSPNSIMFTESPQQAPGFLSSLLPSRSSPGGFLGLTGSGEGGPGPSIQQLGTLMADIATCDPKTEGVCCLARNYCDPNATCFSDAAPDSVFDILNAIPRCTCREGFEGDGRTKGTGCSNIDECATGQAGCEQICKDFAPGYACSCYDGYMLKANGKDCQDINECLTANGGCQHVCVNTPGTFFCDCAAGFVLGQDGRSCTDIDECALDENICEHKCENLPGAFQCRCNSGYKRSVDDPRKCVDRNECVEGLGDGTPACAPDGSEECTNTPGSYTCSCAKGYRFVQRTSSREERFSYGPIGATQEAKEFLSTWVQGSERESQQHTSAYSYITRNSVNISDGNRDGTRAMKIETNTVVPATSRRLQTQQTTQALLLEDSYEEAPRQNRRKWTGGKTEGQSEDGSASASQRMLQWAQALDAFTSLAAASTSAHATSRQKASSGTPTDTALAIADLAMQFAHMYGSANKALNAIGGLSPATAPATAIQINSLSPLLREGENLKNRPLLQDPGRITGKELVSYRAEEDDSQQQTWSDEMYAVVKNLDVLRRQPWIDPPSMAETDRNGECVDIDECAEFQKAGLRACKIDELICVNTPGSYECQCGEGLEYDEDAASCVDIDECLLAKKLHFSRNSEGQGVTPAVRIQQQRELQGGKLLPGRPALCDQQCLNLMGKYECGCYPGFVLQPDGRCDDIDECIDPTLHGCDHICINLPGTYSCQCRPGYRLSLEKKGACVDIDECAENPELCEFGCKNLPGAYECTCPPDSKQRADKRGCEPNLSCKEDPSQCQGDHVCRVDGTSQKWKCSCPDGFSAAPSSRRNSNPPRCVDINECAVGYPTPGRNPCPDLYRPCCLNVAGGFQCVMARRKGLAASRQLYCEAPSFDFQGRLNR